MQQSKQTLTFYRSPTSECGYIPGQDSSSIVVNPFATPDPQNYSMLIQHGFRRSGKTIYRSDCINCQRCIPVRLIVDQFQPNRRFKRVLSKNQDVQIRLTKPAVNEEYFQLYYRYINSQHADGSMVNPDKEDFRGFLVVDDWQRARFMELRVNKRLIALAVNDIVTDGLSSVYTFYDPDDKKRSPGQFSILQQIKQTKDANLPFLYLGYWIHESRKMRYKADFQPLQYFFGNRWLIKSEFEKAILNAGVMGVI